MGADRVLALVAEPVEEVLQVVRSGEVALELGEGAAEGVELGPGRVRHAGGEGGPAPQGGLDGVPGAELGLGGGKTCPIGQVRGEGAQALAGEGEAVDAGLAELGCRLEGDRVAGGERARVEVEQRAHRPCAEVAQPGHAAFLLGEGGHARGDQQRRALAAKREPVEREPRGEVDAELVAVGVDRARLDEAGAVLEVVALELDAELVPAGQDGDEGVQVGVAAGLNVDQDGDVVLATARGEVRGEASTGADRGVQGGVDVDVVAAGELRDPAEDRGGVVDDGERERRFARDGVGEEVGVVVVSLLAPKIEGLAVLGLLLDAVEAGGAEPAQANGREEEGACRRGSPRGCARCR